LPANDQPAGASLTGHLMTLVAAVMLPMLVLVGIVAWDYGHAARRTIEAERLDVANNLRNMIDREIDRTVGFLEGISAAPGLRNASGPVIERVTAMARARGFASLTVYGLDGRPIMNSIAPPPSAETAGVREIAAGAPHFVSGLVDIGERPGLYFVSVPVKSEGRLVAVATAGVPPRHLQTLLAEASARPGWTSSIVDRNGILLARGKDAAIYVGAEAQEPMRRAARGDEPAGLFGEVNREGVHVDNSFERSAASGWVAGVGVPTELVEAPLRRTAAIMMAVGAALVAASLVLAFLVAGCFARAIRRMGLAAVAIAGGDVVAMPESNIAELRAVSRSMERTGEAARQDRRRRS
jgi:hypothetical protein